MGAIRAAEHLAIGIASRLVGRRFAEALREMQQAQWLPPARLKQRTEARLARLLAHATSNVPFYRDLCRSQGIAPGSLRTPDDLRRLPVMTKARFRQAGLEQFLAENVPVARRLPWTTSGSTGEPFKFFLDREALPVVFASHLFYDSWFGLKPFHRYIRLMTAPLEVPAPQSPSLMARFRHAARTRLQRQYERWTQERISLWEVGPQNAREIHARIEAFRPDYILGYCSTLAVVADELTRQNKPLNRPLRAVVTIAETLTPPRRRLIESYFNAPIVNRYGQREFKYWAAQSCPVSPERFHINTELVVPEVLAEDGSPAPPGRIGKLVMSDLVNEVMPFLRYDTGDLGAFGTEPCACGRGFPILAHLEGRSLECIQTPNGAMIHPTALGQYLFVTHDYTGAVRHFQLVQEGSGRARLLVVPGEDFTSESRRNLERDIARLLGPGMHSEVEVVEEIPLERSGKRPIIRHAMT